MSNVEWVFAGIVMTLSIARITRLMIWDKYPPMAWLRAQWIARMPEKWEPLMDCGYCFAVYPAAGVLAWGYLSDWHTPWWLANGWLAVSYLAAVFVTFDGELMED